MDTELKYGKSTFGAFSLAASQAIITLKIRIKPLMTGEPLKVAAIMPVLTSGFFGDLMHEESVIQIMI